MSKNKLTKSILLFTICINTFNYPMECEESESVQAEKIEQSTEYIKQAHLKLIASIKDSKIDELQNTIRELKVNLSPSEIRLLLNTLDADTRCTPLKLAKQLTDLKGKRAIIKILKNNGVPNGISYKNYQAKLNASDAKFFHTHATLMHSIQTGSLENVTNVLKHASRDLVQTFMPTHEIKILNNFQMLVLLNEPDHKSGHTPLTLATEYGFFDIAKLLIQIGAFPRNGNNKGIKPEDIANLKSDPEKHQFLSIFDTPKTIAETSEKYFASHELNSMQIRERNMKNTYF